MQQMRLFIVLSDGVGGEGVVGVACFRTPETMAPPQSFHCHNKGGFGGPLTRISSIDLNGTEESGVVELLMELSSCSSSQCIREPPRVFRFMSACIIGLGEAA